MTSLPLSAQPAGQVVRVIALDAMRIWRHSADIGSPTQPALHSALDRHSCGVVAPVFDSMMRLHERCVGRRIQTFAGGAMTMSADEHQLLDHLAGTSLATPVPFQITYGTALASAFATALRSTRIMLCLALQRPDLDSHRMQQRWLARAV